MRSSKLRPPSLYVLTRMTLHTNLPALCSKFLCCPEDLLHGPGNDTSGLIKLVSLHGVRFSTSCLAIGKAADVVAIQCRLHQQGDLFKDLEGKKIKIIMSFLLW